MIDLAPIRARFACLSPHLDERERRLLSATEARLAGYGGIAAVRRATGIAASTIGRGLHDLAADGSLDPARVRRKSGGRRPLTVTDPTLRPDLLSLVEPGARGDPMSPLRWTCKSLRHLVDELAAMGHKVSRTVIGELLRAAKFSLQGNSKTDEGSEHEDRDAQFQHINTRVTTAMAAGQPVISVDTKKKELVGNFKNNGREWRPQGSPELPDRLNLDHTRQTTQSHEDCRDDGRCWNLCRLQVRDRKVPQSALHRRQVVGQDLPSRDRPGYEFAR
jgi:hypothetical protein